MFQNVIEEDNAHERAESKKIDYLEMLKVIFKYQNIFIYLLTFLLSSVSIPNNYYPFTFSILAACLSSTIPVIGVFLSALIGTLIFQSFNNTLNFFAVAILYFISVIIFRPKSATEKLEIDCFFRVL